MKLLFVTRSTPFHQLGGMEIVAWDLARQLCKRGHEVHILTTQTAALPEFGIIDGVSIRTLKAPSGQYSPLWWKLSVEAYQAEYVETVDMVMGVSSGAQAILNECRAKLSQTPIVMQVHGTAWGEIVSKLSTPNPLMWAAAIRFVFHVLSYWPKNNYTHLIPIGPEVVKQLSARPMQWLVQGTQFTLIENGVDDPVFAFDSNAREEVRQKLHIPGDARVVVSINRLTLQKGSHKALSAFIKAARTADNLHYMIVGEGPLLPKLRSIAADAGLSRKVHFLGAIDRQQIPDILSAADVFLFPSLRQEGLAIAPLEAAANGLRCILSSHIVPPELVCSSVNPRNTSEITAAILSAANAQRSTVSLLPARYSLQSSAERYERLFMELMDPSRHAATT